MVDATVVVEPLLQDGVPWAFIVIILIILIVELFIAGLVWRMDARMRKRLYKDDGQLIYRRAADCDIEMRECADVMNQMRTRIHDHTNKLIEHGLRIKTLENMKGCGGNGN